MNYDRILLELLDRVSRLEEEMANLKRGTKEASAIPPLSNYQEGRVSHTQMIVDYINELIEDARLKGKEHIDIVSNDVQRAVGLKNRIPSVNNAMRAVMKEIRSEVLHTTPSNNSSTYKIRYYTKG